MDKVSFLDIADSFKAIFLDSYGVVKNHRGLIPGVEANINELRRRGKIIRILTNDASRSPEQQAERFAQGHKHHQAKSHLAYRLVTINW